MSHSCGLPGVGTAEDQNFQLDDFTSETPRWCAGCGDYGILTATQKLLANANLAPEKVVFVSGIGCSSRFPHYMKTYGFHGLHGRALPVATGIKLTRPDLDVFVVMGDGDCCSIGAGHWIHAIRYNMNMTVLLLDNNIYGLTKKQTSPTTPQGYKTNTQPRGSFLPPLNPLITTLGVANASFVAQTADWMPSHLAETLRAAHAHKGFSFVRILQRCPVFTHDVFQNAVMNPELTEMLQHPNGITDEALADVYPTKTHDPSDIHLARRLADDSEKIRVGLFFRDESFPRYEEIRDVPKQSVEDKYALPNQEMDRYAI